ncbi:MAG: transporter substrate-binding domain-containing protein [Pseudomonadota bacterium]|nr:transporter substrate-binding domain-containing protein [Pseudomonadota bacterium]
MKIFAVFCLILFLALPARAEDAVYRRVVDSNTIRCGVIVFNQFFEPGLTGKAEPKGLTIDIWKEIARRLQMKVEWVEMTNMGTVYLDLAQDRFNAICHPWLIYPPQLKHAITSRIIFTEDMLIYTPADRDTSAIKSYADLNNPGYRFAGTDGEAGAYYIPLKLPKVTMVLAPQGAPAGTHFQDMITGKADFILLSPLFADGYMKAQPKAIKPVLTEPLGELLFRFAYKPGSHDFRHMIDAVLEDMQREGLIDAFLKKNNLLSARGYR